MSNQNNTPSSLTLDVTPDGLKDPKFIDYLDKHKITFSVLTWDGPGGGNPEVEFRATYDKLVNLLRDQYCGGDEEDVEFQATYIVAQK